MGQKTTWHFFEQKLTVQLFMKFSIYSTQFMNSGLDNLVNIQSDEDFKYLVVFECCFQNLELLKQKVPYPYEYMNSFERFEEKILPARKCFLTLQKKEKLLMMVKNQTVT